MNRINNRKNANRMTASIRQTTTAAGRVPRRDRSGPARADGRPARGRVRVRTPAPTRPMARAAARDHRTAGRPGTRLHPAAGRVPRRAAAGPPARRARRAPGSHWRAGPRGAMARPVQPGRPQFRSSAGAGRRGPGARNGPERRRAPLRRRRTGRGRGRFHEARQAPHNGRSQFLAGAGARPGPRGGFLEVQARLFHRYGSASARA